MAEELDALETNKTWELLSLPKGKHTIGCRWVYNAKMRADGTLECYKTRLVAKDFTQQSGIDFKDTFNSVAKITTLRILLTIAAVKHWTMLQPDINNAFLNDELN
ncbi:Retrovirus-related Pol polyprotein [Arachis hypogaea]|nr:Retrovirus-related Pol polyprotein [Arachis hypogaea]